MKLHHITKGLIASTLLLMIYFGLMGALSGRAEAISQFMEFKYFIMALSLGFGVQVTLYFYLKEVIHRGNASRRTVAVSGTSSTLAMVACCAHYAVGVLPVIGVSGAIVLLAQYQVHLFWLGIAANLFGIGYISRKITKFKKYG